MNETELRAALKESVATVTTSATIPGDTARRARRGRRRSAVAGIASLALVVAGIVAALPATPLPTPPPVAAGTSCDIRRIATIGRDTTGIDIASADAGSAFFTGVSPAFYTATVNDRPRAGRVDANGTIRWIEFNHPEAGFRTRTAANPVAVGGDEAWFVVDAGGRFVGESALWHVVGGQVTRTGVLDPVRSVAVARIAGRDGVVWMAGSTATDAIVARYERGAWTRLSGTIPELVSYRMLTADRGGTLSALVTVRDPSPTGPGIIDGVLRTHDELWRQVGPAWQRLPSPNGLVSAIQGRSAGELFAITYAPDLRVVRFDGSTWATVAERGDGVGALSVRVASDDRGRLVIAEYVGAEPSASQGTTRLWVLDGDRLTAQMLPDALRSTQITGLAVSPNGTLWIAAGSEVYGGACDSGD